MAVSQVNRSTDQWEATLAQERIKAVQKGELEIIVAGYTIGVVSLIISAVLFTMCLGRHYPGSVTDLGMRLFTIGGSVGLGLGVLATTCAIVFQKFGKGRFDAFLSRSAMDADEINSAIADLRNQKYHESRAAREAGSQSARIAGRQDLQKMVDYRIISEPLMEKISNFRNYISYNRPNLFTADSKNVQYRMQVDAQWQEIAEMFPDHLATPIESKTS